MESYKMWIGGKWVGAESGNTFGVLRPSKEDELGQVPLPAHGIYVNAACPGMINTNCRDQHMDDGAKKVRITVDEFRQREYQNVSKIIPIGRMRTVDDISDVVSFPVSGHSNYVTGQAINVCGGVRMD